MALLEPSVTFERLPEADPTRAAVAPLGVLNIWLRQPLDARWTAAFRLVWSGRRLRVGEARIFPTEPAVPRQPEGVWSGCWRGVDAEAPRRGLTKQVLARAQPHLWLQFTEKLVPRFREAFPDVLPATARPRSEPGQRGRHAHADAFLAQIAAEYVRAFDAGRSPVEAVAQKHGEPVAKVRGWIYQARFRGFLTKSVQGVAGGDLTPKAAFYQEARQPRPKIRRARRRATRRK